MVGTGGVRAIGAGAGRITSGDGPGVLRTIASRAALELDPRVVGLLDPPLGGTLPPGMHVRTDADGVRIASINIHMATPGGVQLDPLNEDILALRDVARYVNAVDPDVLLVQELRNRPVAAALQRGGLGDVASIFAHQVRADDMAFTPAIAQDPFRTAHTHYGTAIYTRNGFHIDQAVNVRLPTSTPDIELRSVGVAAISRPDGRAPFTVAGTHLANEPITDLDLRADQLRAIGELTDGIRATGGFAYRDALQGTRQLASGFPRERVVLGGDLNQVQQLTDPVLQGHGLVHVNDMLAASGPAGAQRALLANVGTAHVDVSKVVGAKPGDLHRIDHLYARGLDIVDSAAGPVPRHEFAGDATDHLGLVTDLR